MLTPAASAIRLVLVRSKPSLARSFAVAVSKASMVALERAWRGDLRGTVRARGGIEECEHELTFAATPARRAEYLPGAQPTAARRRDTSGPITSARSLNAARLAMKSVLTSA